MITLRPVASRDLAAVRRVFTDPEWSRWSGCGHSAEELLPEGRGRGRATRAVRLVSAWAFRQMNVARLQLWTEPENLASQAVAERSGYERAGVLRRFDEIAGRRVDSVIFSLVPEDLAAQGPTNG